MRTEYSNDHRATFIPIKAAQLHTKPKMFDFPGMKVPESSGLCISQHAHTAQVGLFPV